MKWLGLFFLLIWTNLVAGATEVPPEPKIRAVFVDLKRNEKDGTEELKLDYDEDTKRDLPIIIRNRVAKLIGQYCGDLKTQLYWYATEYGAYLGVSKTSEDKEVDAHDLARRLYSVFDSSRKALPVVNETMYACMNGTQHNPDTNRPDKKNGELFVSIISCMAAEKRKEMDGDASEKRWHVTVAIDAAFAAMGELLKCPHEMTRLALYQLDAEYKRDGFRAAEVAGKISLERRDAIWKNYPIPTRATYNVDLKRVRIKNLGIQDPILETRTLTTEEMEKKTGRPIPKEDL